MANDPHKKKEEHLTHLDERNQPTMVDVGDKSVTSRTAKAQSIVVLPDNVLKELAIDSSQSPDELYTKKGPVFQTAVIAGTMAVKKTHELIPFCHPLVIDSCKIYINTNEQREVVIDCVVRVSGKTGVEMEALTGASVAALTIYDMCKALSQDIVVKETRLMAKSGGKTDFKRN
jgi:cyclic pyranopterin monophosphate synthase